MTRDADRKYSLIAAICFATLAAYSCIRRIQYVSESEYASITFLNIAYWVILIGFAVTLFIKKKNLVFLIVAGANVLLNVYYIISYVSLFNIIDFLAAVALALLAAVVYIPSMASKRTIAKKVWFLPAALLLSCYLINWFQYEYFSYLSETWLYIIANLVEVMAYFFTGMWLGNSPIVISEQATQENEYESFNPKTIGTPTHNSEVGGADKLKTYKELLDSGIISQEEFDQKKKQILGL